MSPKNGSAAAAEARGVPEFDLLASEVNRENNSATAPAQAAPIVVTIAGPAVAKGRARFNERASPTPRRRPGCMRRTAVWRLRSLWATNRLLPDPCISPRSLNCPIPGSWSKRRCASAVVGDIRPTCRPDIDNYLKSVMDAINGSRR